MVSCALVRARRPPGGLHGRGLGDLGTNPLPLQTRRALLASALSGAAALAAWRLHATPASRQLARRALNIESSIPGLRGLAGGRILRRRRQPSRNSCSSSSTARSSPQRYVNRTTGERVMLSIAYGATTNATACSSTTPRSATRPRASSSSATARSTCNSPAAPSPPASSETAFGRQRFEPVTYWTVIGGTAVRGGTDKSLPRCATGSGLIPDGLLFRVSSIDRSSPNAFALQQRFADGLLSAVPTAVRGRFARSITLGDPG